MSQVFDKVMMYQAGFVAESLNEHRSNNKKCWGSSRIYFLSLSFYQYIYLWELLVTCAQCWGGALPAAICCCGVPCSGGILGVNSSVAGMSVCEGQERGSVNPWSIRANPSLKLFHTNLMPPGGMWEVCTTSFCQISLPVSPVPLGQPLNWQFLLLAALSRGCTAVNASNLTATLKEFCL